MYTYLHWTRGETFTTRTLEATNQIRATAVTADVVTHGTLIVICKTKYRV